MGREGESCFSVSCLFQIGPPEIIDSSRRESLPPRFVRPLGLEVGDGDSSLTRPGLWLGAPFPVVVGSPKGDRGTLDGSDPAVAAGVRNRSPPGVPSLGRA